MNCSYLYCFLKYNQKRKEVKNRHKEENPSLTKRRSRQSKSGSSAGQQTSLGRTGKKYQLVIGDGREFNEGEARAKVQILCKFGMLGLRTSPSLYFSRLIPIWCHLFLLSNPTHFLHHHMQHLFFLFILLYQTVPEEPLSQVLFSGKYR